MGGEDGASKLLSLAEQSEVWERAQELVRCMIQVEAEIQKIFENKKNKDLWLDEVKCLEKTIENKIGEATNLVDAEEAKQDKSRLHAEHAALVKDIKSDLTTLMQLKHSLRDIKEQDLELASKAEDLTDQELSLLDIKRLSIYTTRKPKQQIIQQRRSSEQSDWTSVYESNPRPSEEPKNTESPYHFSHSHLDTPSGIRY